MTMSSSSLMQVFKISPQNSKKTCSHELLQSITRSIQMPYHNSSISCHSSLHSCIFNFTLINNTIITYFSKNPLRLVDQVYKRNHATYQESLYPRRTSTMLLQHAIPHQNLRNLLRTTKVYARSKRSVQKNQFGIQSTKLQS